MKKLLVLTFCLGLSTTQPLKNNGRDKRGFEEGLSFSENLDEYHGFEQGGHQDDKHSFDNYNFGSFHKEPEFHEVTKVEPVHKTIHVPVPHPVKQPIHIPVPVRVLEPYPIKIPVPVTVEKVVHVPVEKIVEYPVEKPVPVKVVKKVRVPVPKPYPVPVPVYKTKYVYHTKKYHHW